MTYSNTISLESNKQIKINFNGGDLSSDAGLLLIKEFAAKVGLVKLVKKLFHTNDSASFRLHTDADNLLQIIYQIIAAYFEDDCADELTNDPVLTAILDKGALASQPTLSRFWNRMDEDTLSQFDEIDSKMREIVYSIKHPEHMLFDLDSTLLNTYGKQEGEGFNYHYQAHGYHPLLCFDGLTGDLLKVELRDGTQYCSKEADQFMIPLMQEYRAKYPSLPLYLRGDSGFASPALYEACEENDCKYAIRLKDNATLRRLAADADEALSRATRDNQVDYAVEYGEFMYQAGSWSHPRRVVFKVEKPTNQFIHMFTFIVTTMESEPYQVIRFYCGRGKMENFIKEAKNGFFFDKTDSSHFLENAVRMMVSVLSYNINNFMRTLTFPEKTKGLQIQSIRLRFFKIAGKLIHTGRRMILKLSTHHVYQEEFFHILREIQSLSW